ncbi:MAG: hypothetical protein GY788_19635 [bacterium]|nr:hypothetical protein [bacterium]
MSDEVSEDDLEPEDPIDAGIAAVTEVLAEFDALPEFDDSPDWGEIEKMALAS